MNEQSFTDLAEKFHRDAETNMARHGLLAPVAMLLDADGAPTSVVLDGNELDAGQQMLLRQHAHGCGAVAVLLVRAAAARVVGEDTADGVRPGLSPRAHMMVVTEAVWPGREIRQVRVSNVSTADDGTRTFTRDDPDDCTNFSDRLSPVLMCASALVIGTKLLICQRQVHRDGDHRNGERITWPYEGLESNGRNPHV